MKRKIILTVSLIIIISILLLTILFVQNAKIGQEQKQKITYKEPYIPKGYSYLEGSIEEGYVIKDEQGNEFVWIPVDGEELMYRKQVYDKTFIDTTKTVNVEDVELMASINTYGGFYISRYELGMPEGTSLENSKEARNIEGTPVSKKNVQPWTNISYEMAEKNARKFTNERKNIVSMLPNGILQDCMLTWIETAGIDVRENSSSWGNYSNNASGRRQAENTGSNENWKAKNLYDVAGNVWEITSETYENKIVIRGGEYLSSGKALVAATREAVTTGFAKPYIGYRAALYQKPVIHTGSWNGEVNAPILTEDMIPIIYDDNGDPMPIGADDERWFDYGNQQWANAMTGDGSFWVWIPRYEYQIHSESQTISINFIPTDVVEPSEDYKIHPAFRDGTNNNFMNGEWDKEISGIWVAKYEMSMEKDGVATKTGSSSVGDVVTSESIKAVSKPGVTPWMYITIGNCYPNSYLYAREKESHLMKNSERGAIAYLTHSPCGRNGTEVTINYNSSYYIGGSEGAKANTNVLQSSTGNSSGIYDLSGGASEYIAGYITSGKNYLKANGSSFVATTEKNPEGYKTLSTKYATVYPFDPVSDTSVDNWKQYNTLAKESNGTYGYGDAILETSTRGDSLSSWNNQSSNFAGANNVFFVTKGYYKNTTNTKGAGIFSYTYAYGPATYTTGFRVVMIAE